MLVSSTPGGAHGVPCIGTPVHLQARPAGAGVRAPSSKGPAWRTATAASTTALCFLLLGRLLAPHFLRGPAAATRRLRWPVLRAAGPQPNHALHLTADLATACCARSYSVRLQLNAKR